MLLDYGGKILILRSAESKLENEGGERVLMSMEMSRIEAVVVDNDTSFI